MSIPPSPRPKIAISANTSWNLFNFRLGLIRALEAAGHEVVMLAPDDAYVDRVTGPGRRHVSLPFNTRGTNPLADLGLLARYMAILRQERPVAYLGYTIKPNVYGSMACHLLGIPVINNIAGLGLAFSKAGWLRDIGQLLYRTALARSRHVFFQNGDDRARFVQWGLARQDKSSVLPGSGIDLGQFTPTDGGREGGPVRFLLAARLLREKGIEEYAEAARRLRAEGVDASFTLVGFLDPANAQAVPADRIAQWEREGVLRYAGPTDDIRAVLAQADCVVLPSYYMEGMPRILLEAAAMALPIITTDWPGCRDAVDDGRSGLVCKPRDAQDLARAMGEIARMAPAQRAAMGAAGREKMRTEFDERIVIDRYLSLLSELP